MNEMNFRTTIFLLIAAVALAVMAFLTRSGREPPALTSGAKILEIPAAQVDRVTIAPVGKPRIVIERSGANWFLREPVSAPADAAAVSALVEALAGLDSRGAIRNTGAASVGLD